jgi:putative endonuclease
LVRTPDCHSGGRGFESPPFRKKTRSLAGFLLMNYYTYIIKSDKDGSFYIGSTSNIERRLLEHNNGHSPYTSKKIPWKLIYLQEFKSKTEAIKREKFLKKQKNKEFYLKLSRSK